jgi:hypothetical protein
MARPREYDAPTPTTPAYQYNPLPQSTPAAVAKPAAAVTPTSDAFVRNPAQEAAAIAAGVATKAEIEARGGVNASGYYGDSYNPATSLTDAEYAAAVAGKTGAEQGAAINAALAAKQAGLPGGGAAGGGTVGNSGLTATQIAEQQASKEAAAAALEKRQSAFDLLSSQFAQYGLQALVDPLKGLIQENISPSEFAVRLRQTEPYKKRFAANTARIAGGLATLSEGEYIGLEDQYQNIMRNYGLPSTYYTKGDLGRQEGFEKLIGYDVSAVELEDRISTAQKRVINAPPEVTAALKAFYPSITNADILAYTLDPTKGLDDIKRKITASEIGGAAMAQGLTTSLDATGQSLGAEALTKLGVTQEEAQRGFSNIASILPTAEKLSSIYGGEDYTRLQAEQEQFKQLASAKRARESLTALETAQFGSSAGTNKSSLTSSTGQY